MRWTLPAAALAGSAALWSCSTSGGGVPDAGPDALVDQCSTDADCAAGLKCDLSSGAGLCRLPNELESCVPDAGCGPAKAVCAAVPFLVHACVFPCQTAADCPDPVTSCRAAPGGGPLLCLPTPCGDGGLWAPCPVEGNADGLCILGGLFGSVCLAGGTAGIDAGCSLARSANGAADRCSPGTACTASDGGDICLPLCGTGGDGGPSCVGSAACVSFTGGPVAGFASFGYCAQTCDPQASDCPSGTSCVDYVQPPVCWP